MKYIVITGGVCSGIGKGTIVSNLGAALKMFGVRVSCIKIDPYLNIDAGTIGPHEHGEVFVLEDGGETDLDLGNYERSMNITLTKDHSLTTGKISYLICNKERKGDFLGKTVQTVPHMTNMIQEWITRVAKIPVDSSTCEPDICLIEIGGTVGDIESVTFLEAFAQLREKNGKSNYCHIHVSPIITLGSGEQKTKPTQHSVKELRQTGIIPDFIFCRSETVVSKDLLSKISEYCRVDESRVISMHDYTSPYEFPMYITSMNIPQMILQNFDMTNILSEQLKNEYLIFLKKSNNLFGNIKIAIVGKYADVKDSYLSIRKAIEHAAIENSKQVNIIHIDSETLEKSRFLSYDASYHKSWRLLTSVDGIIIPGGFGIRGIEGKLLAINHARLHGIPLLGICLGLQLAIIEYFRHKIKLEDVSSQEFHPDTKNPVIIHSKFLTSSDKGGSMNLGSQKVLLRHDSLIANLYESDHVTERFRHRYEVNPKYVSALEENGMIISGKHHSTGIVESIELPPEVHPFFVATQFHPEFTSKIMHASPLFSGLVVAASHKSIPSIPVSHKRKIIT